MKENEFPILKISNVDWDKDHEELDKLPTNFELKWSSKKWNAEEVSDWIRLKFDWIFNDINIEQVGTWKQENG
tara:strand:+ start:136 stop:354 length:219 start_codon:yes stop_codon:yes gene_type:complete